VCFHCGGRRISERGDVMIWNLLVIAFLVYGFFRWSDYGKKQKKAEAKAHNTFCMGTVDKKSLEGKGIEVTVEGVGQFGMFQTRELEGEKYFIIGSARRAVSQKEQEGEGWKGEQQ